MQRIGQGYDVHRLVEGRKLILGGVEIPHKKDLTAIAMQMCWFMRSWMLCLAQLHWVISENISLIMI